MSPSLARAGFLATVVSALLTAGCAQDAALPTDRASTQASTTASSSPAPALEVGVEYPRYLQTRRRLEVVVVNSGREPVTVTRLALHAPQFRETPAVPKDTMIAPGRRVDLQTDFGAADCDVADDAAATAELRVRRADGSAVDTTFDLPTGTLGDIHADECGRQAVAEAVDLEFSPNWEPSDHGIHVDLLARRSASQEPIRITGVGGSVIFTMRALAGEDPPLLEMVPDERTARLPVEIVASRCDPHAVAESKKTYLFSLWVELGTAPEQYLTVDAEPHLRPKLDRLIDECRTEAG